MKNILFLITISLLLMSCSNSKKEKEIEKSNYSGLGIIVDAYYYDNYEYPKNIKALNNYIEQANFPNEYKGLIQKLKEGHQSIRIKTNNNKITICIEDNIIYESEIRTPCNELSYNLGFYVDNIILYDNSDNILIDKKELQKELKSGFKQISLNYNKVIEDTNSESLLLTKYLLLKYEKDKGIDFFCSDTIKLDSYMYLIEIENYLNEFTNKYKLMKVVFTTPLFYK